MIAALALLLAAQSAPTPPNVLLVILDDIGVPEFQAGLMSGVDSLAAGGVSFERAYSNPVCSSTRACIATGRYGFRTGVMQAIRKPPQWSSGLQQSELTLWEHFDNNGWDNWYAGKWHSGNASNGADPIQQGVQEFRGAIGGGLPRGYFDWDHVVNGLPRATTEYATITTVKDAIILMATAAQPWFGTVSLNAAHSPYHDPPGFTPGGSVQGQYTNMVRSADIATRLVVSHAIQVTGGNVTVLVIGDNGHPPEMTVPCPRGSKSTPYEGGVAVPMVAYGPGVPSGLQYPYPVSTVDLFATICEIACLPVPVSGVDSVSFAAVLQGSSTTPREFAYFEENDVNGLPVLLTNHERGVVELDWKLIRTPAGDELFDLVTDPCEATPVDLTQATPEQQAAHLRLSAELVRLGVQ